MKPNIAKVRENQASIDFRSLLMTELQAGDTNQVSQAEAIGVSESTYRTWLRGGNGGPPINWVIEHAPRLPESLLVGLLRAIAGRRFVVEPVGSSQVIPACGGRRGDLTSLAVGMQMGASHLLAGIHAAEADGQIDPEERPNLQKLTDETAKCVRSLSLMLICGTVGH